MKKSATPQTREEIARERLRDQKIEYDAEQKSRQAGMAAGSEFILDAAVIHNVYRHMTALASHMDKYECPDCVDCLVTAMDADADDAEDSSLGEWIRGQIGDDMVTYFWVAGFVSGALAKFRELAP